MRGFFILLLVVQAVSSGSNGNLQNMMNEAITGDSSGSDIFGSCDFEQSACGWNDTSKDEFKWRLEMANISSIPGFDHTTGQPYGKVMHVEGNTSSFYSVAVLERSLPKSAALACQISFWYHLHDDIGYSSDIYLSAFTNTSVFNLWSIRKGQTKGWENATVFIGNRPEGTKLAFSVDPSYFGEQDVMLDDIIFHSCNEGDVPPRYDSLTCDFEKDTCAWYPDHSASVMWRKAKSPQNFYPAPEFDHTTGSGFYMYIGTNRTTNPSMTARLISYPQRTQCVSFWYHIYGASIGSLKFITKRPGEEEIVVWMRSGTQGNKWRFADLSFPATDLPLQFIFEATLGGTDGSIAIDDVVVSSGVDGSCPAERECTFQGSLCGLQHDPSADFAWVRTTASLSPNTSSPAADHTLGTAHGYYLSANLWKHGKGSRGRIQTDVKAATPASGECWMFWYHMDGEDVGELNIYLQQPDKPGSASLQPLWGSRGDQGDLWRHGRATVHSPDANYQIVFEAVVGDGLTGDIAIDDLEILNGPCPLEGFCDFERDLCGWLNRPHNVTRQDWDWTSAIDEGQFSPDVDHTTNSVLGHYMVLPLADRKVTQAYLESEHMEPISNGCLDFWFHMRSWFDSDTISLTVHVNDSGVLHSLWNKKSDQGNVWHHAMIDYMASSRFQIVFEGKNDYDAGSIALDDIFIRTNVTCSELLPTTPAPTTESTTPFVSSMDCNFEEGLCEWKQDTEGGSDWLHQSGLQADSPWLGPAYDHTVGNNKGFYLVVKMSGDQAQTLSSISVSVLGQPSDVCVDFWYYMLGPSVSSLDLQVQTRIWTSVAWTRVGTQTAEWLNAQVTIHTADIQRVLLSARMNSTGPGFIAIDDITVRKGPCQDQDPCGFESQLMCGFEQDVTNSVDWVRVSGTTERVDHTYRTKLGHSMAVLSADLQRPSLSQLLSPERGSTPGTCLRFWHWISAVHNDSLSVHLLQEDELSPALWTLPGQASSSSGWVVSEVTVSSPFKHRVAFRAELSPAPGAWVLLDDVSVRAGACTPPGSCDFESDLCTWLSQARGAPHRHDWVHADGHAQGPGSDHTTHSPDGRFLLSKTQNPNSKAELASEWLQPDADTCFSLWFLKGGSDSETLRLFVRTVDNKQDLIFETSQSGQTWSQTSHSLRRPSHFQIIIEAESGGKGFMAIDDVVVTPGPCRDNVPIHDFVPCQFEDGTCDWQDVSDGQFKWQRDRNGTATANTGPSVDHTTGTELGWYMAVEANDGEHNSYALLQSPAMEQASADCTLRFFYHMHGEGIGELRVLLQEGSRLTPLLQISGNHGDEWQQAELGVGRTPQVFKLLFEATRTFSELGDIAIDDVSLLNCTLSEAADHCEPGFFTCTNRVCVEPSRVCDFTDDCGDRSDEVQCESKGYAEHCSFEQGLCSWESGAGVSHRSGWTRQRGESVWPAGHGPPRDHTRNTAAGYYIVPGYPLMQGQTSEVLSSTLLPSSDCTVRFFHYAQGGGPRGRLTVRLRTEQTGSYDRVLWSGDGTRAFRWRRAEASFSSPGRSKIVFQFVEDGERAAGQVALDDITFSPECAHDPDNGQLPTTPVTCGDEEFYCWRSEGIQCIPANTQCDYRLDCPQGEDEEKCGACSFEFGDCRWQDISQGASKWHLQRASEDTDPPADHTTGSGHYMRVSTSQAQQAQTALLQSPPLPASSPYCQLRFHFHMGGWSPGTLSVSLQSAQGQRSPLWSRSKNSTTPWSLEHVPLGKQQQDYTLVFGNEVTATQSTVSGSSVALDDISFHNCQASYHPPDLSDLSCSFDQGLCAWAQGAADDLDWQRGSGPTDTANTGPEGDHTSGQGHYVYLESSHPSKPGDMAQLNSPLVPPVGQYGYCLTLWYHMVGATVGSLKVFVKNIDTGAKTLVWERKHSQSDLWQPMRHHVVAEEVHQIVLEASVGGESGDIAVDDIIFTPGPCPLSGLCDFEEGDCNWTQLADDDFDWVRGSGPTPTAHTGPSVDHSTNTETGHYYYLESSNRLPVSRAKMASSAFPSGKGKCLQFWYHMFGKGMGTLNVYQQPAEGEAALVFSHAGDMGELWRFAQAPLQATQSTGSYRIVVEGVIAQSELGDMAVDDVLVTDAPCPPGGHCDFELNTCAWTNLYGVDDTDWLRGQGLNPSLNTGPSVDHTTNSSIGYYMYVDTAVGIQGETAMLFSDVLLPARGGHCLTFWFHMFGQNIGTLSLWTTDKPGVSEYDSGRLLWTASGNQGAVWLEDSVFVESDKPSWFMFQYQKGELSSGDVALDDIRLSPGPCYSVGPTTNNNDSVFIATGVVLALLVIVTAIVVIYMIRRRPPASAAIIEHDMLDQQFNNPAADFYGSTLQGSDAGDGMSISNKSYNLAEDSPEHANRVSLA